MIYHKDIGFPKSLIIPEEITLNLHFTTHAKQRKERDNYKLIVIPSVVKLTPNNIIEAYTDDKINVKKVIMRIPYDRNRDITLILQPKFKKHKARVITFWLNHKSDQHQNLNKLKYDKP